jgi:hypothetical protein
MSIIKKMRKQTAVWWARSATINRFGKYSYEEPIEIKCRWDTAGVEFRNTQGQTVMSNSTIYPDRVLAVGDMLKEGDVESDTVSDPTTDQTAYEIQRFDKTPNIKNTETLYTAYL